MTPMRDGARLQTVILTPSDNSGPLPILFRRTPYGVPDGPVAQVPVSLKELAQDGYILVFQNLRGRFKSEGVFKLTSQVDLTDSTDRKSTRLNSSHSQISYAVFCLKKKPHNSTSH